MSRPSLFERVKKSRLAQVLILYLGASWVVLEVTGELQDALSLPEWLSPVAIILLVIGLVVVLATAWVQAHPATDVREEAGEVPDSWEVGVGDLVGAIRRGELPHLTWGRAIVGGVVALSVMFGLAGVFVLTQNRGERAGRVPAAAEDEAGSGLAVTPFSVSGVDAEVYGEGMVSLLGATLDGVPGIRAIDRRTVIARWNEVVGEEDDPDLQATLEVARRAGARYALVGSAVDAGADVGLIGDLYDVDSGEKLGSARAQGPQDSLMALVDRFSVEAARLLVSEGAEGVELQHLESLTTSSLDALLSYVEGEQRYREAAWNPALDAFERAAERDSTFALAHLRAYQVLGWSDVSSPRRSEHLAAARRHAERLPARERTLLTVSEAVQAGDAEGFETAEAAVRRYPDDPDLWNALGDLHVHAGGKLLEASNRGREALKQAAALAPGFVPYLIHLTEMTIASGDSAAAAELVGLEEELVSDTTVGFPRGHRAAFAALYGDDSARRAALATLEDEDLGWAVAALRGIEHLPKLETLWRAVRARSPGENVYSVSFANTLAHRGRVLESIAQPIVPEWIGARNRTILYHQGLLDESDLPAGDWGPTPNGFGTAYTAMVRGDTAAADPARDAFAASLGDAADENWLLKLADAIRVMETRGADAAEAAVMAMYDAHGGGDTFVLAYVQWFVGDMYEQLGDDRTAYDYFLSAARWSPLAALRAARLADRLGDTEEARRLYRGVLVAWEDADPQFQPWLEEARGWLERLPG
jgi:TolB-like protein